MLSDGTEIENPRFLAKALAKLRKAQRRVCRPKRLWRGSAMAASVKQESPGFTRGECQGDYAGQQTVHTRSASHG
jgi:hypothetical protein